MDQQSNDFMKMLTVDKDKMKIEQVKWKRQMTNMVYQIKDKQCMFKFNSNCEYFVIIWMKMRNIVKYVT